MVFFIDGSPLKPGLVTPKTLVPPQNHEAGRGRPWGPSETTPWYPPYSLRVDSKIASLVGTLERRDGLALLSIQGVSLNGTVAQLDLAVGLLLPGQSVLHPLLVVTVGVILTGVSTTGLLTSGSGSSGLGTVRFMLAIDPKSVYSGLLTRKSAGCGAQGSPPSRSSRSCCGP